MPLVLLTLDRQQFLDLERADKAGDAAAHDQLTTLWAGYEDQVVKCFVCDADVTWPISSVLLPEPTNAKQLIVAPLCPSCMGLPPTLKAARCLKVLKKMHFARTGRRALGFHFNVGRRR
jgi:hypothetical protein